MPKFSALNNPIQLVLNVSKTLKFFRFALLSVFVLSSVSAFSQENCANGIDDDGDGLIDLNDDECICEGFGGSANVSSLIPNSSFEDRSCCPSGYSDLGCADNWIQASNPTSDYWHMCGASGSNFDGGTVLPPPDGQGFVGFINMSGWQEYVGSCLSETMETGTTYDLTFWFGHTNNSPPLDLTFYGTPNCGDLPFNSDDCPVGIGGWVELGSINVGGGTGWVEETITFTPTMDINALVMGGGCGSGGARTYYYMDDLTLVSTELFDVLSITQSGQYCDDDITLHALTDSVGGTWQWYKEGIALTGETAADLNVEPGTAGIGNYTVVYTMGSQCESIDIEVVEPDFPTAELTATDVCFPEDVSFGDSSSVATGSITDWNWDFGDGNTSSDQHPTHNYINDGTYDVELTVTTDINCTDTYQTTVTVFPQPAADFSATDECIGTANSFTDGTTINPPGSINTWSWDLNDGNTSDVSNPMHQYDSVGVYDVQMLVESANGCRDSTTRQVEVFPTPSVDVSATEECALDAVTFTNNSTIASGSITQHEWNLGDGNSSTDAIPVHSYSTPDTRTLSYMATSNEGCTADTSFQLIAFPNPVASMTMTDVCADEAVNITDNSSVIAPGIIDTYILDLNDGSPALDSIPDEYQYASAGSYTTELIIITQHQCDDTVAVDVNVFDLPVADLSFANVCEDDSAQFTDLSTVPSGIINSWLWDFGNGTTSTEQNPTSQLYASDGFYDVSLIVGSGNGCSDTVADEIEIYPVPIANFTFDSVCYPLDVNFTDLSDPNGAYDIDSWVWSFSDGQTSTLSSPSMGFGMPGTFDATLLITNESGCKSTYSAGDAVVHPPPVADFPTGLAVCLEDTVFFTDLSEVTPVTDDEIAQWNWAFDDGNSSTVPEPFHVYTSHELYDVNMEVITNHGCSDDVTHQVEIYPLPNVEVMVEPRVGCAPLQVQFIDQSSIPSPYQLQSWNWQIGDSIRSSSRNTSVRFNPELNPLDSAVYDIGLTVTSTNGCVSEIFYPEHLVVHPKPEALFYVDEDVQDILQPVFTFSDRSTENVVLWDWQFGDGLFSAQQNPVHTYPDTGIYDIVLQVETAFGCLDTAEYQVKVEPVFTFYIPNSFTPDNDGINEEFFGQGEGYVSYFMQIYDRWGEMIFESNDDQFHWNGTFRGKQVQQGTYIYYFNILDWKNHEHEYRGHVTLHR